MRIEAREVLCMVGAFIFEHFDEGVFIAQTLSL